jgi:1-acyl-sn-glycerol-3-phosphate acyltransferase
MRQAGYISNALEPTALLEACSTSLASGDSLIVFPEGTRSVPGAPLVLRRGFAHLATETGAPILPVTILCDPPTLVKGEPWWRIPDRKPLFRVIVGTPVRPNEIYAGSGRGLAARRIVKYFADYYDAWIAHGQP